MDKFLKEETANKEGAAVLVTARRVVAVSEEELIVCKIEERRALAMNRPTTTSQHIRHASPQSPANPTGSISEHLAAGACPCVRPCPRREVHRALVDVQQQVVRVARQTSTQKQKAREMEPRS